MKKDDMIGGALLLIAILGIGAFFIFAPSASRIEYSPKEISGSSIEANAMTPQTVQIVGTFIASGFVTIHQSIGGAPGPIIGASGLIAAGTNDDVIIVLSEVMETGMPYTALLHVDNGDGRFIVKDDLPVTNGGVSVRSDITGP